MVRISFVILIILVFGIASCDFFMASTFPDYLPSVRRVESLDKYFQSSNKCDYDMFVMDNGSGNDFVFVLFRPEFGDRKVVVLDNELNIVSEFEDINLGSFHASYLDNNPPAPSQAAAVGMYGYRFDDNFWVTTVVTAAEKDYVPLWRVNASENHACYTSYGDPLCDFNTQGYNPNLDGGAGGINFNIDNSSTDYELEAICHAVNVIVDPNDDDVILFLRRRYDDEGIAVAIPDNEFNAPTNQPVLNSPYFEYHFGPIKPGSVHIIGAGMGAIIERQDGTVVKYWYQYQVGGSTFNWSGETKGLQFRDRIVAYSNNDQEFYVFDPGTKDIFKCTAWWRRH